MQHIVEDQKCSLATKKSTRQIHQEHIHTEVLIKDRKAVKERIHFIQSYSKNKTEVYAQNIVNNELEFTVSECMTEQCTKSSNHLISEEKIKVFCNYNHFNYLLD
jgi:hypothetical protein